MSTDAAYKHFGIQVAEYDETIVRYIPYYRELIDGVAAWLVGHVPNNNGKVCDTGTSLCIDGCKDAEGSGCPDG